MAPCDRLPVGRVVDVASLAAFDALVARGARRMRGWRLRGVDLRERTDVLVDLDPHGALLLGCELTPRADDHLRNGGAVVFPDLPDAPVDPYRAALYTAEELYAGIERGYRTTPDACIYAWASSDRERAGLAHDVASTLHDASIEAALDAHLAGHVVVGVMGGHAAARGDDGYRRAARLGRALARSGVVVATGGGPGTMEAVHLGARLAGAPDGALDEAVEQLAAVASYRPSVERWAAVAFDVRRRWPDGDATAGVGIPTWFYGHEPSNVFAAAIAKYVQNAVREATLLRRCDGGIVFLPGAAGTVQEIFQDACENYYADPATVAPMVLVGVEHWTRRVPAWPLLAALAAERAMADRIALVDDVEEAAAWLARHRPGSSPHRG
jgi:predicted Rossmann-fold nucleotide-binding protein